ncbi:3922_t:CDS:1, partial [Gigaspora rosea]
MSETFVLTEVQNTTYSYPQKNGNPLIRPEKQYYRKAHTYFDRNVAEWKLTTFCYFMDNRCGKVGRVNAFVRFVYENWLGQKLSDKSINADTYLQKLRESQ